MCGCRASQRRVRCASSSLVIYFSSWEGISRVPLYKATLVEPTYFLQYTAMEEKRKRAKLCLYGIIVLGVVAIVSIAVFGVLLASEIGDQHQDFIFNGGLTTTQGKRLGCKLCLSVFPLPNDAVELELAASTALTLPDLRRPFRYTLSGCTQLNNHNSYLRSAYWNQGSTLTYTFRTSGAITLRVCRYESNPPKPKSRCDKILEHITPPFGWTNASFLAKESGYYILEFINYNESAVSVSLCDISVGGYSTVYNLSSVSNRCIVNTTVNSTCCLPSLSKEEMVVVSGTGNPLYELQTQAEITVTQTCGLGLYFVIPLSISIFLIIALLVSIILLYKWRDRQSYSRLQQQEPHETTRILTN